MNYLDCVGNLRSWLRDGLSWRWQYLQRLGFLVRSFRNGIELARRYRHRLPCSRAVLWDGTELVHPSNLGGLTETLLEIWRDQVYTKSFYEPAPGDVVIDGGANIGLFCIWLAKRQPRSRILAFEPFEQNFRLLQGNIASTGTRCIRSYRAGLSGSAGVGHMVPTGTRSLDHQLCCDPSDCGLSGAVPLYSLAQALELAQSERIALFKIDIEGSEHDLFERAADADLRRVDRFAIEYHEHVHPGTLALLQRRLAATHRVEVSPQGPTFGMVYASMVQQGGANKPLAPRRAINGAPPVANLRPSHELQGSFVRP